MSESLASALLVLISVGPPAYAQPSAPTPQLARPADAVAGPFHDLSPGDRQIARVLFDAQPRSAPNRLTLNQIAIRKLSGQGWGRIVQDMKARGLVSTTHWAEIVRASERFRPR